MSSAPGECLEDEKRYRPQYFKSLRVQILALSHVPVPLTQEEIVRTGSGIDNQLRGTTISRIVPHTSVTEVDVVPTQCLTGSAHEYKLGPFPTTADKEPWVSGVLPLNQLLPSRFIYIPIYILHLPLSPLANAMPPQTRLRQPVACVPCRKKKVKCWYS